MVIRRLTGSYRRRVESYDALGDIVLKILGRLILSRGDFSGVKSDFEEKQILLDRLEKERVATMIDVEIWQNRKSSLSGEKEAQEFDRELLRAESAIRRFLEAEDQLKRYLEQLAGRNAPALACAGGETEYDDGNDA
jgi:hypothetical protein